MLAVGTSRHIAPQREANGSVVFHSGCCGTSALTRSSAKCNCTGIGCSHHRVPSLSKVAMRSGTGTKCGEPGLVTFSTKAMMDCFAGPSFHDGKGSSTGMIDLPPAILRRRVSGTAHWPQCGIEVDVDQRVFDVLSVARDLSSVCSS